MKEYFLTSSRRFVFCFTVVLLLCTVSCSKSVDRGAEVQLLPNTKVFYASMDEVWDALVKTLRYDFLYELAIVNKKAGYLVTELVRDYQEEIKVKHRISASLKFDGKGVVVVLYNERQFGTNKGWETVATDYSVEQRILRKMARRVGG